MTDTRPPVVDTVVLGELAAALFPQPPWSASDGFVYHDDGDPDPWDRTETLIAKCYGGVEESATNSQFIAFAGEAVPILISLLERSRTATAQARIDAARLAEAVEDAVKNGGMRVSTADALTDAVARWEQSLREAGLTIGGFNLHKPAGVQVDKSEKHR